MKTFAAAVALFAAVAAHATEGRDPFAPYAVDVVEEGGRCAEHAAACVALDDFTVKGIVTGTASPRAMVEVKGGASVVVRVGDVLSKGRIVAITRRGIVIERISFSAIGSSTRTRLTLPLG